MWSDCTVLGLHGVYMGHAFAVLSFFGGVVMKALSTPGPPGQGFRPRYAISCMGKVLQNSWNLADILLRVSDVL